MAYWHGKVVHGFMEWWPIMATVRHGTRTNNEVGDRELERPVDKDRR